MPSKRSHRSSRRDKREKSRRKDKREKCECRDERVCAITVDANKVKADVVKTKSLLSEVVNSMAVNTQTLTANLVNAKTVKSDVVNATTGNIKNVVADDIKTNTLEGTTITGDQVFGGCERLKGVVEANVSLSAPCFTFTCNDVLNIQQLQIEKDLIEPEGTLHDPFETLPILSPPAPPAGPCPQPGGDPLVTSTVDVGVSFQLDYLIFTNNSTPVGTQPIPEPSTGPWYFEKEPYSPSNKTVITVGCREVYSFPNNFTEQQPPSGPSTTSILDLVFDQSSPIIADPDVEAIQLEVTYGYSNETSFDYFTIFSNNATVLRVSGFGPDADHPYNTGSVIFRVPKDGRARIQFLKDPAVYRGVDSCYFRLDKVAPIKKLKFPTHLEIKRDNIVIQSYDTLIDLDSSQPVSQAVIDCTIDIQSGDQLCLTADSSIYNDYNVQLSLENVPQIKNHRAEENFAAVTRFNQLSYNNRLVSDQTVLQGWYDTDSQSAQCPVFIEQIPACGTDPGGLSVTPYATVSSGAYFLNSYLASGNFTMVTIGINKYKDTTTFLEYVFDPTTGELRLDVSNPENIPPAGSANVSVFRPIGNPDEKYWKYKFDLLDYNYEFNTPINFYDFVSEYYKAGFISSLFGIGSSPSWPNINPLNLDLTQVKGSFGINTRQEYDNLVRVIRDIGIERKYDIQRFIYWPQPGDDQPMLSDEQKRRLRWQVNQNRYPFLAFCLSLEGEGGKNYPKIMPGETVTVTGTGTPLDGFPLRLAMDGYHTGPKPAPEFMQTYSGVDPRTGEIIPSDRSYNIFKEWAFYTARLPITIDSSNDTIRTRNGGLTFEGEYVDITANFVTVPPTSLGPFQAGTSLLGQSLTYYDISGLVVAADPINADAPMFNNADEINGNVVIVVFDGTSSSSSIARKAVAAGATGLLLVSDSDELQGHFFSAFADLPTAIVTSTNGQSIIDAVNNLTSVSVNVVLSTPVQTVKLPHGTYYLSDIYQLLYGAFNAFESEFFIDVGNFISVDFAINSIFALVGSDQSALYGPNDPTNPSNFFGPNGLNVAYLWEPNPSLPLFAFDLGLEFFWGSYAQLLPGEYKTHTPLSSSDAQKLIDSIDKQTANVSAKHGPVQLDMKYSSYIACINELSMAKGTEIHTSIGPYLHAIDNGLFEMPESFQDIMDNLKKITVDPTVSYSMAFSIDDADAIAFAPTLYSIGIRPTIGHPGEFSEMYSSGELRSLSESQTRGQGRLEWIIPQERFYYPPDTIVSTIGHGSTTVSDLSDGVELPVDTINVVSTVGFPASGSTLVTTDEGPQIVNYTGVTATSFTGCTGGIGFMAAGNYVGNQNVGDRQVEIAIVNYLEDPQWLSMAINDTPAYAGATDFSFIPYVQNTPNSGTFVAHTRPGTAPAVISPDAVIGNWLVGTLQESKTREILGLGPNSPVPGIGYMTWYFSEWGSIGDPTLLPWYDPEFPSTDTAGLAAAARILQYFNSKNVKHIIIDVRNTIGGNDPFWQSFAALIGGKRYFSDDTVMSINPLEPNGFNPTYSANNMQKAREEAGVTTYSCPGNTTSLDCNPDAYVNCGILDVYPDGVWNGEITGQSALGLKSNVIWLTNSTTISNPQFKYLLVKGTSLDGTEFNGDFGRDTQFVAYGVYYKPFSTAGDYLSYINWWTVGRKGTEEVPNGLMFGIDRYEANRFGYLDKQVDGQGGILKGGDQDFTRYHQPQIKWDMNADVFFQDIGFVKGNQGVDPVLDGEPWLPVRYPEVDFSDPLTYRDTVLERCVQMATDPNLSSHFYVDDGYGYVSQTSGQNRNRRQVNTRDQRDQHATKPTIAINNVKPATPVKKQEPIKLDNNAKPATPVKKPEPVKVVQKQEASKPQPTPVPKVVQKQEPSKKVEAPKQPTQTNKWFQIINKGKTKWNL